MLTGMISLIPKQWIITNVVFICDKIQGFALGHLKLREILVRFLSSKR